MQKVLNKRAGMEEVLKGNYYVVNTEKLSIEMRLRMRPTLIS